MSKHLHQLHQCLGRRFGGLDAVHQSRIALHAARGLHRQIERLFIGKMLEKQGFGDPRGLGQFARGGAVESFFRENPANGADNIGPSLAAGKFDGGLHDGL